MSSGWGGLNTTTNATDATNATNTSPAKKRKTTTTTSSSVSTLLSSSGYVKATQAINAIVCVVDAILSPITNMTPTTAAINTNNGLVVVENDGHAVGRYGTTNPIVLGKILSTPPPIINGIVCAAVHAQNVLHGNAKVCCISLDETENTRKDNTSSGVGSVKEGSGTEEIVARLKGIEYLKYYDQDFQKNIELTHLWVYK